MLGAVALGNADPAETLALRAHLDGCAECRTELRELTSVAAALPLADPARVTGGLPQPPPALAELVLGRVMAERTAHRRRTRARVVRFAAAAAAIAAAVVALVVLVPSHASSGTHVEFASTSGITAAATLRPLASGTEVAFHVAGLHAGEYYWLWLTGDDGHRIAAGTFRGTTAPADLVMNAGLSLDETRRIWVTDEHDHIVLDQRLPAPA